MKKTLSVIGVLLVLVCGVGSFIVRAKGSAKPADTAVKTATVTRGLLNVEVVETGTIDANKTVDVKGRVTGRLAQIFVEEGQILKAGDLIALIDPKETRLMYDQNAAQLRGAQTAVDRGVIEIAQKKQSAQAGLHQSEIKRDQLKIESDIQPTLTQESIQEAQTALNTALDERKRLIDSIHPTERASTESALREAQANYENASKDYVRQSELEKKGFVSGKVVEAAQLTVDVAKTRLDSAKTSSERLEAQLSAEIAKADEAILQAKAEYNRALTNKSQDVLKKQDYLQAVDDYEKAKAAIQDIDISIKDREQSMATVDQLGSALKDAQRQLGETDIRAPMGGIVTKKALQVGELATGLSQFSSGSTIVKIEDRSSMRVRLDVNEIDVARMRVGMKARVDVDALPNHPFEGVVSKIAPASKDIQASDASAPATASTTDAVVKYQVEIKLASSDPLLRSGMSAKCVLDIVHDENVLKAPIDYVVHDGVQTYVLVAGKNPKAPEKRMVTVGASSGSEIEIASGVKQGDVLVKPGFSGPARKGAMQFGDDN
jgi:HlyD family secretion protein